MFSQIKLYFIGACVGLFGLLGLYAKFQKSQKEKYKQESEVQKDIAQTVKKRVEAHEKREEIEAKNVNATNVDVDTRLHEYYRD